MNILIPDVFDIRYCKLHFVLGIVDGGDVPMNKTSALRGGMGEMLLRANCIQNRDCANCDFFDECIVQRTMYSRFTKKPAYMQEGDSIGYVVECENYCEHFEAGDELRFNLLLFGKTIVYFSQYVQAVSALGRVGLGKSKIHFQINSISNTFGEQLLTGDTIDMQLYKPTNLKDYIEYRFERYRPMEQGNIIEFCTPVTLKSSGIIMEQFDMPVIIKTIQRRLDMMNHFEEKHIEESEQFYQSTLEAPIILEQEAKRISVRRYSFRKGEGMYLTGIKGTVVTGPISDEVLQLLFAGEILHIGKNTSFGYGRYYLK